MQGVSVEEFVPDETSKLLEAPGSGADKTKGDASTAVKIRIRTEEGASITLTNLGAAVLSIRVPDRKGKIGEVSKCIHTITGSVYPRNKCSLGFQGASREG